jgi:hypothetical protein
MVRVRDHCLLRHHRLYLKRPFDDTHQDQI